MGQRSPHLPGHRHFPVLSDVHGDGTPRGLHPHAPPGAAVEDEQTQRESKEDHGGCSLQARDRKHRGLRIGRGVHHLFRGPTAPHEVVPHQAPGRLFHWRGPKPRKVGHGNEFHVLRSSRLQTSGTSRTPHNTTLHHTTPRLHVHQHWLSSSP